jgi:hypothetical protein
MSFEARCPQCLFVTRQLGQPTPCLLHVSLPDTLERTRRDMPDLEPTDATYDEPYAFGQPRPNVDHPGPFSLREYVRLQLLRSRIDANPSELDQPAPGARAHSLSYR